MWEVLDRTPQGSIHLRKLSLLLATMIMACFGYIFVTASPAAAAPDATWDNQSIQYANHTYDKVPDTSNLPTQVASSPAVYAYIDSSKDPNLAHFIYFSDSNAQSEKEATYIRYTLNPPNSYSNSTGKKTLSITPVPEDEQLDTEDANPFQGEFRDTCTIDGIGWMVCPLMNSVAEGMDFIFERIRSFLVVQPISTDINNPIYRIWQVSRDLANVAFVIGFLVIIYNYIVGGGMSGYEIRKIIPRLVVAAILINISYIICSVAVDISNIMGYGVNELFEQVRDNVLPGSSAADDVPINWTSVTTWVLAGGAGAGVALATLPGTIGGAAGLWYLLAPFLFGAALLIMVTFIILAARQAIIIIAIAIAPLAFAAFILPNTEKWFERWRSLFFTMLVMFPAFAAVFGGSQLAGEVIIRSANSIEQVILGLGVMVAPLAITPLLLKLGGGILGRIGGMINNKEKGLADRFKNYSGERRADAVAKRQAMYANARRNNNFSGFRKGTQAWSRRASANYAKDNYRKEQRKLNEEAAQNDWHSQTGRWGYDSHIGDNTNGNHLSGPNQAGRGNLGLYKNDNQLRHNRDEARHEEHWQQTLNSDATRREMLTDTRLTTGRSDVIQKAHEAQDERTLQNALNDGAGIYTPLKALKIQTTVDSGVADLNKNAIEAAGQQEFRRVVSSTDALAQVVKSTHQANKQAEIYEKIVQKAAEESWSDRIRTDANTQTTYLESTAAEDKASVAEKRLEEFTKEVRARGDETRDLITANGTIANTIRSVGVELAARESAIDNLKDEQSSYVLKQLSSNQEIRSIAGAGTQLGATKVLAKAQSGITKMYLENVKAQTSIYSNDGYRVDEMLGAIQNGDYKLHDGTTVDTVAQHAAIQYVMEDIGNNWSVQKIIDWADTQGMELIEGKNGEPDQYYDAATYRQAKRTGASLPPALNEEEISERRDLLQMVVGGYKNGKNKVSYFTNTLQERMNRGLATARYNEDLGRDMTFSETSILGESKQQKYDPNRITSMDPDELSRMAQALREPAFRKQLTDDQRRTIVDKIVEAQTSPQTRHLIKGRERGLMNIVASYLELPPDANPPLSELQDIEQYYYQVVNEDDDGTKFSIRVPKGTPGAEKVKAAVEVPNVYDYTRQVDQVSGTGLKPRNPQP